MGREKSKSPEKVKRTSVTVKKVSTIEKKVIVLIVQFIAVVLAFLLRSSIENDLNKVNVFDELEKASNNSGLMTTWDTLQSGYKCCGGRGNSGYKDWEGYIRAYPDSCCTVYYPDCGIQAEQSLDTRQSIYERIHTRGCITVIKEDLEQHVNPLSMVYGILGLIVCVCLMLLCGACMVCSNHLLNGTVGTRKRLTSTVSLNCPVHGGERESGGGGGKPSRKESTESRKSSRLDSLDNVVKISIKNGGRDSVTSRK